MKNKFRNHTHLFAVIAAFSLVAGCKKEVVSTPTNFLPNDAGIVVSQTNLMKIEVDGSNDLDVCSGKPIKLKLSGYVEACQPGFQNCKSFASSTQPASTNQFRDSCGNYEFLARQQTIQPATAFQPAQTIYTIVGSVDSQCTLTVQAGIKNVEIRIGSAAGTAGYFTDSTAPLLISCP